MIEDVVIVGGGFSGTLAAINLHRHGGPRATLIERGPAPASGLAFGAADASHVLNVRASNMSAFPDRPNDFVDWLGRHGEPDQARAFVPRPTYGRYLRDLLDRAIAEAGDRVRVVDGEAVDVTPGGVTLADGRTIRADKVILAVGNLPPHRPAGLDPVLEESAIYRGNPWASGTYDGLRPDEPVLVLGTGLTMVDVALLLDAHGFTGPIVALSRRGLVPQPHDAPPPPWERISEGPTGITAALVAEVRRRAAAIGWRNAVDELRPFTQQIWRTASETQRARFLRHLRPWWDIHRHRLAPEVADRLAAMRASGQLTTMAGKASRFSPDGAGAAVEWRPRGSDRLETLRVQRIINCTGLGGNLEGTSDPLLRTLARRGSIRPDAARLGIDVDQQGRVIGADGASNPDLFAIGPLTRGAVWEIVAVPDIRAQAWWLARQLSDAHWVGGEGL